MNHSMVWSTAGAAAPGGRKSLFFFLLVPTTLLLLLLLVEKSCSFSINSSSITRTAPFSRPTSSSLNENPNPIDDLSTNLKKTFSFLQTNLEKNSNVETTLEIASSSAAAAAAIDTRSTQEILSSLGVQASPDPKVGYVDPKRYLDIAGAAMPFILRLGSGAFAEGYKAGFTKTDASQYVPYNIKLGDKFQLYETSQYNVDYNRQPRGPIILYEFEGCPFCRKVREAVSILSLEVEFRPCSQGSIYRKEIKEKYGRKATFPFMEDPNKGIEMFESDKIIAYLFRAYSKSEDGNVPSSLSGGLFTTLMTGSSLLFRLGKGSKSKESNPPATPLTLWTAEGTPFGKLVREELNELQISHIQISCPRGSVNRQKMFEQTGIFQIPYLEDPNNGVKLFESCAIIEYLQKMYGVKSTAVDYL